MRLVGRHVAVRLVGFFAGRLSVRCVTVGFQVQLCVYKEILGRCISTCLVLAVRSVGSGDSDGERDGDGDHNGDGAGAGQSSHSMLMMMVIVMMTMMLM